MTARKPYPFVVSIQQSSELVRVKDDGGFLADAELSKVVVVDVLQTHYRRVVLEEAKRRVEGHSRRQIEL